MKKITNILLVIYILLLYFIIDNHMQLLITINFSLYLILKSLFSTTKYNINKNKKLLIYTIITIILLAIPLSTISYLIGDLLNIEYLNITNLFCTIFLITNIIIKLLSEYYKNKKIQYINSILAIIINILLIILLKTKYTILYLYITQIIISIILTLILLFIKHKDNNNISVQDIKKILITDKEKVLNNLIKSSYLYISLIILYHLYTNKYINSNTSIILSNTFFFGIIFIYIIYKKLENNIKLEDISNYDNIINKLLDLSLTICIPLMIISYPLSNVIFKSNYNFIFPLIILLFFYIIYDKVLLISKNKISNKKIYISIFTGIIIKTIIEIPLINSSYRMGYDLTLGSIISTSIGLLLSIILLSIFITKKYKIDLINCFNNILNTIYTNIIYLLILILFTLIIKVDNNTYYINILVIILYISISIILNIIKKRMNVK